MHRTWFVLLPLGLAGAALQAQADSTVRRDTTRLPDLEVHVTRAGETRSRLPMAVGVLGGDAVRRAQVTSGLDESLSRLPGVVVFNRSNYSVDQRVSLRGAGSRANFGLRGVKVLIDGVPQTLPDGQSQLTNLELGIVDRVEVLTGSAGALYGNGSGGVLAFTTENPISPFAARVRVVGGTFGTAKWQAVIESRRGAGSGLLSYSRFTTDGFRQHGGAELRSLVAKGDYALSGRSTVGVRLSVADAPRAEHPGALTAAEYAVRRDSAAANNILRGADKDVSQRQLSLRYRWSDGAGAELEVTGFAVVRNLVNPLATSPPTPPAVTATSGTYNTIYRQAGGARIATTLPISGAGTPLRLTAGVDVQAMRDDRTNQRSAAGVPTGTYFADQRESVTEAGPFVQVHWAPSSRLLVLGAARYDNIRFRVQDHYLGDAVDNSGKRRMQSASGSVGASVRAGEGVTLYGNISTSFETPTTTELVNQSNGSTGFNSALGPQRTLAIEVGARGRAGAVLGYSLAVYAGSIRDAIIQAKEKDGRAFFENAGRARTRGVEVGLDLTPVSWIRASAAYTFSSLTFGRYRIPNGATIDTLDGNRLAGVPRQVLRATVTISRGPLVLEVDQQSAGAMFGDDRNTLRVEGWGVGVTGLRASATLVGRGVTLEPFAQVANLFDRRYVGSVNLNGVNARILEPAPGRAVYVGATIGWRKRVRE
jgi:iron complex outermembrane receptor protein